MKQTTKYLFLILIVCSLLLFGYYRDFVFKNINFLLQAWDADRDYNMPSSLGFLKNFEYATISKFKWVFTFGFALIYLSICLASIKLLFDNKKYLRIAIYTYLGITIVSMFLMAIGFMFHSSSGKIYEIVRYLMGMLQSPIILMVLIPAFKLNEKEIEKKNSNL